MIIVVESSNHTNSLMSPAILMMEMLSGFHGSGVSQFSNDASGGMGSMVVLIISLVSMVITIQIIPMASIVPVLQMVSLVPLVLVVSVALRVSMVLHCTVNYWTITL
jgi:hypothetical protein